MIKPLDGITVVDLSRAIAGPYCTALLADLGARIIKVESISGGDTARHWPPFQDSHSLYFESMNRNKRSVCLDLYSVEGREVLERLIAGADVLVENFKLGTLANMGLTDDRLRQINPDLIVASVTGFGQVGPLKNDAGLDQVIQGMSGLMSVTGPADGGAFRVGVPIVDLSSGLVSAFGVVGALLGRERGHDIQHVSTSLLETALNLSAFQGQRALSLGDAAVPQGNAHPTIAPYGVFRTGSDDIIIAVGSQKQWQAFCALLGIPDALDDPRFRGGADRMANRDELTQLVESALAERSAAEWTTIFSDASIPCGPVYDYVQAFGSEQVAALGLVRETRRRDGTTLPLVRGPVSIDGEAADILSPPPLLGEHTVEVLRELGLADDDIDQLERDGRIAIATERAS